MKFILARHGNTFEPHEPAVWTGTRNDLPLVKKGIEQAELLGKALLSQNIKIAKIYCSELQRTSAYANIIGKLLNLAAPIEKHSHLNEIDYGDWTGLTSDEIKIRFGEKALKDWEERSIWPKEGNWKSSSIQIINEVHYFVSTLISKHQPDDTLLLISSNGRLRYFLTLVHGELENRIMTHRFKMNTGNIGSISHKNNNFELQYWNQHPTSLINL